MEKHQQKKINDYDWDVIREQIERSKIKRIPWKKYFGRSLTKEIAELYALGYNAEEAFNMLRIALDNVKALDEICRNGWNRDKVLNNLKIGVCARFGEIKSEGRTIKEIQK